MKISQAVCFGHLNGVIIRRKDDRTLYHMDGTDVFADEFVAETKGHGVAMPKVGQALTV